MRTACAGGRSPKTQFRARRGSTVRGGSRRDDFVSAYRLAMPPRDRTRLRAKPRQPRAAATVEAILEATARLLATRGFAQTTTNRIAQVAGVNVALVYRYFSGKEAIIGALVDRAATQTIEAVRTVLATHERAPLPEVLRALIEAAIDTPGLPALHRELVEHVDVTRRRDRVHELRAEVAALFAELLERRAGELRSLPDAAATRFVLAHTLEAVSHAIAFYRPPELDRARTTAALLELVSRALLPVRDAAPTTPRARSAGRRRRSGTASPARA
jgi:AcrR family transcriptional regulator